MLKHFYVSKGQIDYMDLRLLVSFAINEIRRSNPHEGNKKNFTSAEE